MAETVLTKLAIQIAANTAEFNKSLSRTEGNFKSFTSGLTKIGATLGVAFGIQQVASFAFEISKLAGEAEGVKAAFDKLPDSVRLLEQLKEATAGTVSELDLMKRTVQASNFGIALESLPQLLEFASIRAQQTGQSVDYLVDSIITGIGRKSPLILDNLGISAVRLKEKFNGASLEAQSIGDVAKAVGKIATEELEKMGDFSENTSTKIQRLSASWDNFKVAVGDAVNETGILQSVLDGVTDALTVDQTEFKSGLNQSIISFNNLTKAGYDGTIALQQAELYAKKLGVTLIKLTDPISNITKLMLDPRSKIQIVNPADSQKQIQTLEQLQAKLKDLNDQFNETDTIDKRKLANIGSEILKTKELIAELEKYRNKEKESNNEKKRSIDLSGLYNRNLLTMAQAFNAAKEEARKASEEIFKFTTALMPVSKLPDNFLPTDAMRKAFEEAKAIVTKGREDLRKEVADIGPMIANGIAGIADALGTALGSGNFKDFGKGLLEAVATFAQQLGSLMIASGIAQEVLKSGNPYAMIVAGVALVAAGAAIKATLNRQKKFPNASSGGSSGGGGSSFSNGSIGSIQNQTIKVEVFGRIDGQDIWLSGTNYNNLARFTKTTG